MVLSIGIEKPSNHPLILGVVSSRLALEKFDATLAQSNRNLDSFLTEHEVLWTRKKVRNDLEVSERFVGVSDFRSHKFSYLSANGPRRRFE